MHDAIEALVSKQAVEQSSVFDAALHQPGRQYGIGMAGREIVKDDHLGALLTQHQSHMRADVSCAADDQYFHFFTFIIYGYDKEKFCRWANFLKNQSSEDLLRYAANARSSIFLSWRLWLLTEVAWGAMKLKSDCRPMAARGFARVEPLYCIGPGLGRLPHELRLPHIEPRKRRQSPPL